MNKDQLNKIRYEAALNYSVNQSMFTLHLASSLENGFHAGFDSAVATLSPQIEQLKTALEKTSRRVESELENNDYCDCGYEEPRGEGYVGGICFLHGALSIAREALARFSGATDTAKGG